MKSVVKVAWRLIASLLIVTGLIFPGAGPVLADPNTVPVDDLSIRGDGLKTQTALASYDVPKMGSPDASHDNDVWWDELGHNSRDSLFRAPGGAVPIATPVSLRFRAASGDLTAAKVRIYNDRENTQTILNMTLVADDGVYEWWQAEVPASPLPTVYWYRFIAIDGTDTDYYADDDFRLGGWGVPSDEAIDNSWQLTVYAADFQTPEWAQNAIIYQIFPDRFRDGDLTNDTPEDSFFYGDYNTIYRSNSTGWNQIICDPRDDGGACPGVWSQNFYGGDLQGVINQLDYLQELGITAIYFNPIFESPSNHRYDTTDYSVVDDSLGDLALFETLVSQAGQRGMVIILDGVFNHTSSDSIYFDRYQRYDSVGACESQTSIYRDWYFFTDVAPGTGTCVGSNGTPDAAIYTSWWGYDSLPKLNSTNSEVRDLIYASGSNAIGPYWVIDGRAEGWRLDVGGDVDPGTLVDPANDYWEGFRNATHAVNPDTYIVGEEWGYATSWTLGGEWDGTMNYMFSSAVLGFWRDEAYFDNDHNPGSAAGVIEPLMPSQLDERIRNLQERYAPEAFAAMMNLLGSHDTNRALFMLDHNTDLANPEIYLNPEYDWSDALNRLRGVVILQMTLPGAPTIYYGDEVGLVGPVAYDTDNDTWQDDPYNRAPYPWLNESGTLPYYTHLQSQSSQDALRDYYILLTSTRNDHAALRTGTFDTLLMDDPNLIYAYGRRLVSANDAVVVVLNRHNVSQTVTLDLSGYLPAGAVLADVLNNNAQYTIASDGTLILPLVPTMSGMVLTLESGNLIPPSPPTDLSATEGESIVDLFWSPGSGAVNYLILRSLVSDGGYTQIGETANITFSDSTVTNGVQYYYVVKAVNIDGMESPYSNEAGALPHWNIDWADLHSPAEITHTIGLTPTNPIFGQVYIEGVTNPPGATPELLAQVGFGPAGVLPDNWSIWVEAVFDSQQGDNDQFTGQLIPEDTGEYEYVYRYSTTSGRDWVYADLDGVFNGTPPNPGILHVNPSDDTIPPATPDNLLVADWGADFVSLGWDPVSGDPTMYAYDVYRSEDGGSLGERIARILDPGTTFTDTGVTTGVTYYYVVQALDSSFNRSGFSNQVSATPLPKMVNVTINVDVPNFTVGTIYIVGNQPELGNWNPAAVPMTQVDENTWTIDLVFLDGLTLEFKFTRGNSSWLDVEKEADGNTEIPNRTLLVDYGSNGYQVVDLSVANWRDPLIVSYEPADGATDVPTDTLVTVTWSQSMAIDTDFILTGPGGTVPGSFSYDPATWTVTFTPAEFLEESTNYQVSVSGEVDSVGDAQLVPVIWSFNTGPTLPVYITMLPFVPKN